MHPHSLLIKPESIYLIRLIGELDAQWLEYFKDISIAVSTGTGHPDVSTISLHGADQAQLLGLLNMLYSYQYPILSIESVGIPVEMPDAA